MTFDYTITMELLFQILAAITITGTVASSLRDTYWWVKVCDVGRVHTASVIFLLLVAGTFYLNLSDTWVIITMCSLLICLFYHLKIIAPFFPFSKTELSSTTRTDNSITVLSVNVRLKNKKYQNLIELVNEIDPDVFLITEVDQKWLDSISVLTKKYIYTVLNPLENTYGIALYSKLKLEKSEVKYMIEKDIPSIHSNVQLNGQSIQLLGLHPRPPAPWTHPEHKDLELIMVAGLSNINSKPTIVTGDLNDVGWSKITRTFKEISGLLDPRIGRGFFNTYNALIPIFQFPVDHFFVSKHFKLIKIKKLKAIGSDHYPVLLEVNLEKV